MNNSELIQTLSRNLFNIELDGSADKEIEFLTNVIRANSILLFSRGDSESSGKPFYISELLNSVFDQTRGLISYSSDEFDNETRLYSEIRSLVNKLEDYGDLIELSDGYWLPTPLRLVHLKNNKVLLLSSLSNGYLKKQYQLECTSLGFARFVDLVNVPRLFQSEEFRLSLTDWLGNPPTDLLLWLSNYKRHAADKLRPSASSFTDFEVYVPSASNLQFLRWKNPANIENLQPGHLYLCRQRQKSFKGLSAYWLANLSFDKQEVIMIQEHTIPFRDIRRLQYSLDLESGRPISVFSKDTSAGQVLTLKSYLPSEGMRLLMAFGKEVSEIPGKLPVKYKIESGSESVIFEYLLKLGITIIPELGDM